MSIFPKFRSPILLLLFVFIGCIGLSADTISGSIQPLPQAPPIPGSPVDFYYWSGDGPFGSSPLDDPGFLSFLNTPGAFFFTGNTAYNFNGVPALNIWSSVPSVSTNRTSSQVSTFVQSGTSSSLAAVPEPTPMLLAGIGLVVIGSYRRWRSRASSDSKS